MATSIGKFRREATEEPYVVTYEQDGETKHLKLANPNRLVGKKFREFVVHANAQDLGFILRTLAGDNWPELDALLEREKIDGEGQADLVNEALTHYGFNAGEASASST